MMKRALPTTIATLTLVLVSSLAAPGAAQTQVPTFDKAFNPSTIGPGSASTLVFDIVNPSATVGVNGIDFTDNLPAGVVIATPAGESSSCGGTLSAPAGGTGISLTGGQVGAASSCSISVNVTSATSGTHTNVSGDLTSSAGNSGTATADLTVATDRPGFSKSFSPSAVGFGGRTTLTFLIDNSANTAGAANMNFTDNLPPGITVASPANAATTCTGGTISAVAGGSVISYSPAFPGDASVAAGSTCTVSVEVIGGSIGVLANVSGELTSTPLISGVSRSSGKATAALTVTANLITLTKEFTDDPVIPGGTVTLEFEVLNRSRSDAASNIAFSDDLDAVLSGLAATGLPASVCGGTVSGTSTIDFSGGSLAAGTSCTISVSLQVPAGAAAGAYTNTTSSITADVGGATSGDPASDVLFVAAAPTLTKTFLSESVASGSSIDLEFTIVNTDPGSSISSVAFIDELTTFMGFPVSVTLPAAGFCGAGSSMSLISLGTERQGLSMTGGSLAAAGSAGDSCTFSVTIDIPIDQPPATYTNLSESITAVIDSSGDTVTGAPATDSFQVVAPPVFFKEFIDDPVAPGGTATLRFTLTYDTDEDGVNDFDFLGSAADIAFTDDLGAVLAGLTAIGLPANDVCGTGSVLSGTTTLSFTGGSLDPSQALSCSFTVSVQVPAGASAGSYNNTTSNLTATVAGESVIGESASDDLRISGLSISKEFTDDPVIAGGTVNLRFTIQNDSPTEDATDITFTDNLDNVVDNLAATGVPLNDVCGTGSSLTGLSGNTLLVFVGGSLSAGSSCTFDVALAVPAGVASDTYSNITSNLTATVDGTPNVAFDPADDLLVIASDFLALTKEFTDDPVIPGGTVNLQFSLTNLDSANPASGIAFTDDLDAVVTGLVATGLPIAACGGTVSGTSTIDFSGGSLAAGASCSFDVSLSVPATAGIGTSPTNTTSTVTGTIAGLAVNGDPASDDLEIDAVEFSKAFSGPVEHGSDVTLTFTLTNLNGSAPVDELNFFDDLEAVVTGLAPSAALPSDPCGVGSSLSFAAGVLSLSDGVLPPGGSCSFDVVLGVPASTPVGDYPNVTSSLRRGTAIAAPPASDTLTVTGCVSDAECQDGLFCNGVETCDVPTGFCQAGTPVDPDDGVGCTDDSCDEVNDIVVNTPNDANCDNGLFCDGAETCDAVLDCQAGTPPDVDDGVGCTDDSCDEVNDVIVNTPNDANCDNGLFCDGTEVCDPVNDCQDAPDPCDPVTEVCDEDADICEPADEDGDGVLDIDDVCPGTVIPESVPQSGSFKNNRYALTGHLLPNDPADPYTTFEDTSNNGPVLTTEDTGGCSCEQIVAELGLGQPQLNFGCTQSNMQTWIDLISGGSLNNGRSSATPSVSEPESFAGPKSGLFIEVLGEGGAVSSSPVELPDGRTMRGLSCSESCGKRFPAGEEIRLFARPDGEHFEFVGWDGDCQGTDQILTVTLRDSRQAIRCTATFRKKAGK